MAASSSDYFRKASSGTRPIVANLGSPKANGATTAILNVATGWNTATGVDFIMYLVDAAGEQVPGSQTDWVGVLAGTTLSSMVLKAGTEPANGYPQGSSTVVEATPTAAWADSLMTGILIHADQDGTLKAGSVDTTAVIADGIITAAKLASAAATTAKTKLDTINFVFNTGTGTDQTNTSTTYVDVTGSSMNYTAPAGNGVTLLLTAEFAAYTSANANNIVFNVGGSVVGRAAYTELTSAVSLQATAVVNVAAGATVAIKLQMKQTASGTGTIQNNNTRAAELQPRIVGFAVSQ